MPKKLIHLRSLKLAAQNKSAARSYWSCHLKRIEADITCCGGFVIILLCYCVIVLRIIGVDIVKEWRQTYRVENYIGVDITKAGRHIVLLKNLNNDIVNGTIFCHNSLQTVVDISCCCAMSQQQRCRRKTLMYYPFPPSRLSRIPRILLMLDLR